MNRKTLLALVVVTAALILIAVSVSTSRQKTIAGGARLLPDLKASLNEISRISIVGKGGVTIATLERGDTRWTLTERDGYPVDLGKLRQILISLADAEVIEEKTSIPEYYDRLGVEDVALDNATGHRIDLYGAAQTISVIVGNTNNGNSTYVRRAGEAASWLVSGAIELDDDPVGWLARDLIEIPSTRIATVTITHPDGEVLRLRQQSAEQPGFEVLDIPKDRVLSYENAGDSIGRALASLTFDDVTAAADLESNDIQPVVARFGTFDGLVIEARSYHSDDTVQVRFSAFTGDSAADNDAVSEEAEAINTRLGSWAYTLPEYQSDLLVSRMDDLLLPTIDK